MASVIELYEAAVEPLINSIWRFSLEAALMIASGNPFRKFSEKEIADFEQWLEDSGYYECETCRNWTRHTCMKCLAKVCVECGLHEDECNCDEDE